MLDVATPPFEWIAGDLSLNFANTITWDVDGPRADQLGRYRDFVRWAREAGLLTPESSARLLETAERETERARGALERALTARRLIREVFHARASEQLVPVETLDALSTRIAEGLSLSRIVPRGERFAREWTRDPTDLDQVIRPVLSAAADLLLSERVALVRECANQHCGWLFLDESRNHMRRWCDMRVCGSRAKARRHYARVVERESCGVDRGA